MYLVDTNLWLELLEIISFDRNFDQTDKGRKKPMEFVE